MINTGHRVQYNISKYYVSNLTQQGRYAVTAVLCVCSAGYLLPVYGINLAVITCYGHLDSMASGFYPPKAAGLNPLAVQTNAHPPQKV